MIDPAAREQLPLRLRDAGLVADGERDQDAGVGCIAQYPVETVAHVFAQTFDQIAIDRRCQPLRVAFRMHITRGAQFAFQHPRLKIMAVRIARAVRLFQAHGKTPAFASMHVDRRFFVPVVGGEENFTRDVRPCCFHRLDIEHEALPALMRARHLAHHAGQQDVAPLPAGRQAVG